MSKFMQFDLNVKNVFENDESNYDSFNKLMLDYSHNMLDGISAREANDKIVEIFRGIIGCDEKSTKAEIRRGIRRNQALIFDLIEVVIDDALVSGWQDNPFFREFVEVKNLALHDKNEFYVPDNSVLSVMKVSGNHHDLIRQRLGAGKTFSVETSWYGIKVYAEFERLLTGLEDFGTLVGKITEAFDRYVNQALYEALIGVGSTLGSQWYKTSALNDTTKETLRTLCMDVSMDVLFIMPVGVEPMIKLVYEGDTQMYQVQDAGTHMDMTYDYEVMTKMGVGVITNQKFGMWKITA